MAPSPVDARVVWIRDTLSLADLEVSEALLGEVKANNLLTLSGAQHPIHFGPSGTLVDAFS
jgi:hypothetical protein